MSMPQTIAIETYLADRRGDIEMALADACDHRLGTLLDAIRYSLLAGGKRLRPILVLAAAEAVGGERHQAMPTAVAFEMLHTQSLIYDDLPCMDDDDLRRGKPTSHKVFGEATALLAGDAMITLAVAKILDEAPTVPAEDRLRAASELVRANVTMCQGQFEDLRLQGGPATPDDLISLHRQKTGSLIAGALRAGAWIGGGTAGQVEQLGQYGLELGLAFQIVDDILDHSATAAELGKTPGKDLAADKATYPKFFGLAGARGLADEAGARALAALADWDERAEPLRALVAYVLQRRN
ncbi:MAG: polyprenyl synthetase family protein [Candidatus Sericytochromatia bacterium]|nr:polyprenyl synthetase family protein [Candidatus Sericytochromatia bacterium]